MPASVWFVLSLSLSNLIESHTADCQLLPNKDQINAFLTNLLTDCEGEGGVVEVDVLNTTYACQALGTPYQNSLTSFTCLNKLPSNIENINFVSHIFMDVKK